MKADVKGALENINQSWKSFEHRGKEMSKIEVFKVLEYAALQGYKHTGEIPDNEIDLIIKSLKTKQG